LRSRGLGIAEREILMGIVDKAKDKAQVAKGEVKEKAGKAQKTGRSKPRARVTRRLGT
jgi:hypothetical protein